jgi:hypothetical protein
VNFIDNNETAIVRNKGLAPIVEALELAALGLERPGGKSDRDLQLLEELATQSARALRNLSVHRKLLVDAWHVK